MNLQKEAIGEMPENFPDTNEEKVEFCFFY